MIEEVTAALKDYFAEWKKFGSLLDLSPGMQSISQQPPTNLGWKVADIGSFNAALAVWMPLTTQLHVSTVDDRKLGLLVPATPVAGVPIIELMQRRPGSLDALGLDHVAFFCADIPALQKDLNNTSQAWEKQGNTHHSWISLKFGDRLQYEAKFFNHTALRVAVAELHDTDERISAALNMDTSV